MYSADRFLRTDSMPCNSTHINGNFNQPNSLGTCSSRELLLDCHLDPTVFIPDDMMNNGMREMGDHVTYAQSNSLTRCKFQVCRHQNLNTGYLCGQPSCPLLISCTLKAFTIKTCFMLQGRLPCPLARALGCQYHITCRLTLQWKPLIMITLGPALFDNNNRLITLSGGYKNKTRS